MAPKARSQMIEETRAKLLDAGRQAFGSVGYAQTSMDELTASVGLTRGALYHHFGDKKGLLQAVVQQIDAELDAQLAQEFEQASSPWEGFRDVAGYFCRWPWRLKCSALCCAMLPLSWVRSTCKAASLIAVRRWRRCCAT